MAKLDTLDATQPADTEVVSQGASRMREERAAIKDTFDDEHYLTGEHKIPAGANSDRPAPGSAQPQRVYINYERGTLEQTFANIWIKLRTVQPNYGYTPGIIALTTGFQILASVTFNVSALAGILAFGYYDMEGSLPTAGTSLFTSRIVIDGVTVADPGEHVRSGPTFPAGGGIWRDNIMLPGIFTTGFGLTEGAHTVTLQALENTVGNTLTASNRFIGVIVL